MGGGGDVYSGRAEPVLVSVIRRECGRTLVRVRVSRTYISIIIISLQRT